MGGGFFDLTLTSTITATAAATQAGTAIVIWRLTRRLTTATENYATETKRMVDELAERRREELEDRKRAHAVQVSAWLDTISGNAREIRGTVQIRNGGLQPIYDVKVTMTHAEFHDESTSKGVVPPMTTHPKTDWTLRSRGEPSQPDRAVTAGEFDVEIAFRDAEGRKWKRDFLGGLHLLETRVAVGQARETDAAGSLPTPSG
jgi:hypothetical protein